ncbi:MAG: cyclodeaminase/cyclohydrolase family protein [Candidatus Omnitrophota bacterium]|nr:cyclodeaminase/cyclohydrolase family protein [Candidatus Omnitrophota bacterium]
MYIKESVENYLNDLAAKKPAPGGGSAAALNAAIGAGLMSMAANYTDGAEDILKKTEYARNRLQALIDADIEAYGRLSKVTRECKDPAKLETVYREAASVPYEVCNISAECLKLCGELAGRANKKLITDVAIAAICLEGAFFAAKYNVYINLKYIKDMDFIGKMHKVLQPLEEELPKLKEDILERCEEVIG